MEFVTSADGLKLAHDVKDEGGRCCAWRATRNMEDFEPVVDAIADRRAGDPHGFPRARARIRDGGIRQLPVRSRRPTLVTAASPTSVLERVTILRQPRAVAFWRSSWPPWAQRPDRGGDHSTTSAPEVMSRKRCWPYIMDLSRGTAQGPHAGRGRARLSPPLRPAFADVPAATMGGDGPGGCSWKRTGGW